MKRLVVGCGYLGRRVAQRWSDAGDQVAAVTRSGERARALGQAGWLAVEADVLLPHTLETMKDVVPELDSAVYAVGYDRSSSVAIDDVYAGGLQNVLDHLPATTGRVIYISSTGVYGPADGRWVDEQTPPNPRRAGGRASLAAEKVLANHRLGKQSAILRLAGIYGPGRVPHHKPLRAGEPIGAPEQGWLNLIHVADAAAIVVAVDVWLAGRQVADGPHVFCVSDGNPVVRGEYYREAARLIGAPPPRFTMPDDDSPAAARAASDKRVSNEKLCRIIGPKFDFPSYRAGLAQVADEA